MSSTPATEGLDAIYEDRNCTVLLAARLAQLLGYDVRWDDARAPEVWPVLFVQLPTGSVSWHLEPKWHSVLDAPAGGAWDGHTNADKAERIRRFLRGEEQPRQETTAPATVAAHLYDELDEDILN
jgi:hypothetical protein